MGRSEFGGEGVGGHSLVSRYDNVQLIGGCG